ncbi:Tetratricopeptide repeat protein 29 [Sparganum proliferum]
MHETFTELFELANLQEQRRLAAGPESDEWTAPQLRDQAEKLQLIRDCLVVVETARLSGDYDAVFRGYLHLIRELSRKRGTEDEDEGADKWLVEYFLEKCLQSSREVTPFLEAVAANEGRGENDEFQEKLELAKQRAAEALYHAANFVFTSGKYEDAADIYRQLYTSTQGTVWITPTDEPEEATPNQDRMHEMLRQLGQLDASAPPENSTYLHITAAEKLSESLLCLVECIGSNLDQKACDYKLTLLTEACALAKEEIFKEIANESGDLTMELRANAELAILKERLGCLEESIKCLQNLKRLALNCNDARALVEAEVSLGRVYSKMLYCEGKAKRHCAEAFRQSTEKQSKYDETENRHRHTQALQLLKLCLMTVFTFDGTIYGQVRDTPMGSPTSGFIAEAILQRLESLVFQHHRPKFWALYVNDTCVVIERDQVLTFKEHLNAVFPDI